MMYWFQQFLLKKNLMIYTSSWLLPLIIGGMYLFYNKNYTVAQSEVLLFLSLFCFLAIFFVVETERMYRLFKATRLRLLPVSVGRIYFYNLLFILLSGLFFAAINLVMGYIMLFIWPEITFTFSISGLDLLLCLLKVVNLFLMIQLIVYSAVSLVKFVPKRYRPLGSLILFVLLTTLLDYFLSVSSTMSRSFLGTYMEQLSKVSLQLLVQLLSDVLYIGLTCWLISRYVEGEE
jgi:hypothetical protein